MDRAPGLSARLKLTLSYAGFLMLAGALLLAAVWLFLLRYVPRPCAPRQRRQQPMSWSFSRPCATSCTFSLPGQPKCRRSY